MIDIEDLKYVTICDIRRERPPIVPYLCPFREHLEVGKTYRYCTCGRSDKQPWCDDSHKKTDPQPIEFTVTKEQTWHWLCGCKYSLQQPWCDGSHIHAVDGYEENTEFNRRAKAAAEAAKAAKEAAAAATDASAASAGASGSSTTNTTDANGDAGAAK